MAQLISMYLAFAIRVRNAISMYDALAAITVKPAYSPAEALQSRLARHACAALSPALRAAMPREKATARYP